MLNDLDEGCTGARSSKEPTQQPESSSEAYKELLSMDSVELEFTDREPSHAMSLETK